MERERGYSKIPRDQLLGRNTAFLVTDVEMEGLDRQHWAAYGSAATRLYVFLLRDDFEPSGPTGWHCLPLYRSGCWPWPWVHLLTSQ
ncbi:hypothetical protein BS47DRAFT_313580 [Hydnum rufescens UP504]|uniref:Uncharacterized protein n=1 Tax=Hydnum rufescens UP504 TaxID=1448309 RepID=A0A9P6AKT3_9AGAM|nr:hypothetical protein BS47DRAFT_313580 [Hydnum rufescens UP504]